MDGIEPALVDRARHALGPTPGVVSVPHIQLRSVGHRLQGAATLQVADAPLSLLQQTLHTAGHNAKHALPSLDDFALRAVTAVRVQHH